MKYLKKMSLLTALAALVVALSAGSASADILDSTGAIYNGPVSGTNVGTPTLTSGDVVVSCNSATTTSDWDQTTPEQEGIDGDWDATGPANAVLDFGWSDCSAVSSTGGNTCSVNPVEDVSVIFDETILAAPDSTIINTERGETLITCLGVFVCTAASDPATGSAVEADADAETNTVTINDVVEVSGTLCPDDEGVWDAVYAITPQGLNATGSQ
jgi:hypothetical protein